MHVVVAVLEHGCGTRLENEVNCANASARPMAEIDENVAALPSWAVV